MMKDNKLGFYSGSGLFGLADTPLFFPLSCRVPPLQYHLRIAKYMRCYSLLVVGLSSICYKAAVTMQNPGELPVLAEMSQKIKKIIKLFYYHNIKVERKQ